MTLSVGTNTYVDATTAAEYCTLEGLSALTTPETSLVRATRALDRLYGARFIGRKQVSNQILAWPRFTDTSASDAFGEHRDFTVIPTEVQQAAVELAVLIEANVDVYAQSKPLVIQEAIEVSGIKDSKTYARPFATRPLAKIETILAPLMSTASQIKLVR